MCPEVVFGRIRNHVNFRWNRTRRRRAVRRFDKVIRRLQKVGLIPYSKSKAVVLLKLAKLIEDRLVPKFVKLYLTKVK